MDSLIEVVVEEVEGSLEALDEAVGVEVGIGG